jgi:tripartite-type tricarboxylate transporter receptor subunit TctC
MLNKEHGADGLSAFARRRRLLGLALVPLAAGWPAAARAADFPARQVRIVVPFAPGAAADLVARLIAQELSAMWGQQVIVENRAGGNSVIGVQSVVRAEPDGHTLVLTSNDSFATIPHLYAKPPYDPLKDLAPVNLAVKVTMIIVANAAVPADSLAGLIAYAKANPGKLSYGSYGTGSSVHLTMETLKSMARMDMVHVPYKGVAPALAAVASGEVGVSMMGYGTARALLQERRIKPIVIASGERAPDLPNVPTLAELGFGAAEGSVWWGLAVPARTPATTIAILNDAVSRVLQLPKTRKTLEERSLLVANVGPKPFAEVLARESEAGREAVRRSGATAE